MVRNALTPTARKRTITDSSERRSAENLARKKPIVVQNRLPKLTTANQHLNRAGDKITTITGTMWVAIAFAALACVSLPAAISSHDPIVIVSWIAQTFLQLVLLPVIMVGQNIQSAKSEARDIEQAREVRALFDNLENANAARHNETHDVLKEHGDILKGDNA